MHGSATVTRMKGGVGRMGWFLGLGIAGVVLLGLSLVFDGVLEGVFDGVGVLDGLFDGLLSLPVIAGFVSMLGFSGAIAMGTTGVGVLGATAIGTPAGLATGWLAYRFSRVLLRDRSGAAPRDDDLIGSSGSVVTAIPAEGYGEVLVHLAGQPVKLSAKSARPVARGTVVWVEGALSQTAVSVRPVER
jgi:membrane protein implicated in regulation of membrane protease activity